MKWRKLGLVWCPVGDDWWARSHATLPTPLRLSETVIRVFVNCLDDQGRGRPIYVDVDASDPTRVLGISTKALLDVGAPGCFDDNGVCVVSVTRVNGGPIYMYYAGFELCANIRYRIFTGLAISHDNGDTFERYSQVPVLDRTQDELYFRCGPFAMFEEGVFRLWYIGGSKWTEVEKKSVPVYDLRYLESKDGISWAPKGKVSMEITAEDEHGFGRPWVVRRGHDDYQLFYSIRRRSHAAYRLGYAESPDGVNWVRKDEQMGLDVTSGEFDSGAIMYSAVISVAEKTYCFYNGNNFGQQGFGVAELES
jgi:hypothetical protein